MTGWFRSARGELRENSAVQSGCTVDYIVRVNIQPQPSYASLHTNKRILNINIRPLDGSFLKDGIYLLEENGATVFRLVRTNAAWRALCPGCVMRSAAHQPRTSPAFDAIETVGHGECSGICQH